MPIVKIKMNKIIKETERYIPSINIKTTLNKISISTYSVVIINIRVYYKTFNHFYGLFIFVWNIKIIAINIIK